MQLYAESVEENMHAAVDEISAGTFNLDAYSYPRTPEDVALLDEITGEVEANGGY